MEAPYKTAAKAIKEHEKKPIKALAGAASLGASAYGAFSVINRALPLLSSYIPQELAQKGLSKINPKLGEFVGDTLAAGFGIDEIKDFLKSKLEPGLSQDKQGKPIEKLNIIQQYSDQLHQFLEKEISNGRSTLEAGALAQLDSKYKDIISKIEKDHKLPWSSILASVYGDKTQKSQSQPNNSQQNIGTVRTRGQDPNKPSLREQIIAANTPSGQAPQGTQQIQAGQMGPGMQALTNLVQQINQKLGA